jgi:surfactin synthase thioesterase subunit
MDKISLFCLPFAGGSKYSYKGFEKFTPNFIKLHPLELAGRGSRFNENLRTDIHEIVDDLFSQVHKILHQPYAIYGHSMGTLLGYLLVKRIIKENLNTPLHLFFTGGIGPSIRDNEEPRYLLPKQEFIEKIKELGGLPNEVIGDEVLLDFFEPILRADMQAIETYQFVETQPFDIPMTVVIGINEKATYQEALAWKKETIAPVEVRQLPGNHFFIFEYEREIVKIIANKLNLKILY